MRYVLLQPHTPLWFASLACSDPSLARHTQDVIGAAARSDVCSLCGSHPAAEYRVEPQSYPPKPPMAMRLCPDCKCVKEEICGDQVSLLSVESGEI